MGEKPNPDWQIIKPMTRNQAVEAMMNGRDTKGEYLFINNDGFIPSL